MVGRLMPIAWQAAERRAQGVLTVARSAEGDIIAPMVTRQFTCGAHGPGRGAKRRFRQRRGFSALEDRSDDTAFRRGNRMRRCDHHPIVDVPYPKASPAGCLGKAGLLPCTEGFGLGQPCSECRPDHITRIGVNACTTCNSSFSTSVSRWTQAWAANGANWTPKTSRTSAEAHRRASASDKGRQCPVGLTSRRSRAKAPAWQSTSRAVPASRSCRR